MTPFFKTYTGTGSFVRLETSASLFYGTISCATAAGTLRLRGQTTNSAVIATTDTPLRVDGLDLSQVELSGNTAALRLVGGLQ